MNTDISSISNVQKTDPQTGASGSFAAGGSKEAMGQEDFLKLLMTQLQHQDPMNPMDNQEFASQLAQFSSIEKLGSIKKNLDDLLTAQLSNNAGQAVSFLGKHIRADSDVVAVQGGKSHEMYYRINQAVSQVEVRIKDSNGRVVATFQNQPSGEGLNRIDIDKLITDSGQKIPDGQYHMVVSAMDGNGKPVLSEIYRGGKVTGVSFKNGAPMLLVNGAEVPLYSIIEMSEEPSSAAPGAVQAFVQKEVGNFEDKF